MPTSVTLDPLLSPEQTAAILGTTEKTLNVWRCTGRVNLPYVKVGARVRYRQADIEAFITHRTRGVAA